MPWRTGDRKSIQYLKGIVAFLIITGILTLIFRKKTIEKIHVEKKQIQKARTCIIWYFAVL